MSTPLPPLVEPAAELTREEVQRYSRHLIIPDLGLDGQKRLKNANVLVIGAGGLGSPTLLYLAAAGEIDDQRVGDVARGEADILRARAVDIDVEGGRSARLLDARIDHARHHADARQQRLRQCLRQCQCECQCQCRMRLLPSGRPVRPRPKSS